MEKLTVLVEGKPMVIEPEATIELDEVNPLDENVKMYSSSAWM